MDCIRAQQLIKGYLEGQLSDRDLEAFLDHVAGCRKCYDELEIYFSVYHLIDDRKDDGNYNFIEKLDRRLEKSREYLKKRLYYKIFRVVLILLAELVLMMSVIGAYSYRYSTDRVEILNQSSPKENPEGEAYADKAAGENGSGNGSASGGGGNGTGSETIADAPGETESELSETESEFPDTEAEEKALEKTREALYYVIGRKVPEEAGRQISQGENG